MAAERWPAGSRSICSSTSPQTGPVHSVRHQPAVACTSARHASWLGPAVSSEFRAISLRSLLSRAYDSVNARSRAPTAGLAGWRGSSSTTHSRRAAFTRGRAPASRASAATRISADSGQSAGNDRKVSSVGWCQRTASATSADRSPAGPEAAPSGLVVCAGDIRGDASAQAATSPIAIVRQCACFTPASPQNSEA